MENLLESTVSKIEPDVHKLIKDKVIMFSKKVCELSDMKSQGVLPQQIIEMWNESSDIKVDINEVEVNTKKNSTPRTRVKTDKDKKCTVRKTRGEKAGEECGRNCIVGEDFCSEHLKNNIKSPDPSLPAPKPVTVSEKCVHILQTGIRKNSPCGKSTSTCLADGRFMCSTHISKYT